MDVNKQYPLENHQTILQVFLSSFFLSFSSFHMVVTSQLAVEAEATEFVSELLRHPRTDPNLPDQVENGFRSFTLSHGDYHHDYSFSSSLITLNGFHNLT